jgi:hypothetical protein
MKLAFKCNREMSLSSLIHVDFFFSFFVWKSPTDTLFTFHTFVLKEETVTHQRNTTNIVVGTNIETSQNKLEHPHSSTIQENTIKCFSSAHFRLL